MNVYLCTKPLQVMVCASISESQSDSVLLVVDLFKGSETVSKNISETGFFYRVLWFKNIADAYKYGASLKPTRFFIDSDVGAKAYLRLLLFKTFSPSTKICIYEEGLGTYRNDLIKSGWVKTIRAFLGVGNFFGGSLFVDEVYVYQVARYASNMSNKKVYINEISPSLSEWIDLNIEMLSMWFSFEFYSLFFGDDLSEIALFLSDWEVDFDLVYRISRNRFVFFKPHPNIKEEVFFNNNTLVVLDGAVPAELIVMKLLAIKCRVVIFHYGSSVVHYLRDYVDSDCVREIDLSKEKCISYL